MKLSTLLGGLAALATTAHAVSQAEAESRFRAVGITSYSSGGCTDRTNPRCTSYEGLRETTVQGAITLKRACGCALTITGGTETGHASGTNSHANGWKLDFRKDAAGIDSYVKGTFTRIANRGDGYPQWQAASGNIYCDEGSHWDVTFFTNGS